MNVSSISGTQGSWPALRSLISEQSATSQSSGKLSIPQDQLEISPAARLLMELSALDSSSHTPERAALINRIREEIAQGTYDTDEKLELALKKFLEQHSTLDD